MKVMHSSTPYKIISCILGLIMIFYTTSCKNYFMIEGVPTDKIVSLDNINETYNSVVIHSHRHNSTYNLTEAAIDSTSVSGLLSLSANEFDYKMRSWYPVYKVRDKKNINVVHLSEIQLPKIKPR